MKYAFLLSFMLVSSSLVKASEVVMPKRALFANYAESPEVNARAYVSFHFRDTCKVTQQLAFLLVYQGDVQKIHECLDTLGDLSSVSKNGLRLLLYKVASQQEFALLRRLLTYERVRQVHMLPHLICETGKACPPIALLVSKAFLMKVTAGDRDSEEIKKEYLRNLNRYALLEKLPAENALLNFVTTLDWERSKELAKEYEAYFTFQDAVERGDQNALVRSLPKITHYDDEFGEPADGKAFRLGHRDISCQVRIYRSFADRFVSFILGGSEEELRRAALLINVCPALASEMVRGEGGQTVLHAAVIRNNRYLIELILGTNPALLFVKDSNGSTPIRLLLEGKQDFEWFIEGAKRLEALDKQKGGSMGIIGPVVDLFRYVAAVVHHAIEVY